MQYGRELFFQCNFSDKDVDKTIPKNTVFKEILTAWCSENTTTVILCYGNEMLWNNKDIKAGGNTTLYTDWYNKGITYFKDIINNTDKTIYSFANLKDKFDLTDNDFLKYFSLVHTIPNIWKTNIKNEILNTPVMPTLISQVLKAKQTKKIYLHVYFKKTYTSE